MDKALEALGLITKDMAAANIAVPIIFDAVVGIAAIIKAAKGTGPTLLELADLIQTQIDANDAFGQAEIDRLKAVLAPPAPPDVAPPV